ncbi:hypothetical protein J3R82DRAFT_5148 [Butyriboletus roseoflavus]|nr:hypothetical protein J3R82DRAFT_5148 [Butyriboletus roseoflavus]
MAAASCNTMCHFQNRRPTSARTGAKHLRSRLRGPSMVNYYPKDIDLCMSKFAKEWPELELVNFAEAQETVGRGHEESQGEGCTRKGERQKFVQTRMSFGMLLKSSFLRSQSPDTKETVTGLKRNMWITLRAIAQSNLKSV